MARVYDILGDHSLKEALSIFIIFDHCYFLFDNTSKQSQGLRIISGQKLVILYPWWQGSGFFLVFGPFFPWLFFFYLSLLKLICGMLHLLLPSL
jgi:hypothetical protein